MNLAMGLRAAGVLAVATIAVIIGSWIGNLLLARWPALSQADPAAFVAAGVALLLGGAALVLALPSTLKFVRCGFERLGQCARDLWPALLFLGLGTLAVTVAAARPAASAGPAPVQIVFGQTASHDSVFVPFFPIEGRSENCSLAQTDFGEAQKVTGPGVGQAITDLMRSLAHCADGGDTVKLDVRGFASSSEFRGCTQPVSSAPNAPTRSEYLNWRLAEARRRTVIAAVRAASSKIVIEPAAEKDRWAGPREMRASMQFFDRNSDGSYDRFKGALTRRAEIIILSKGSCEPVD